MKKTPITDTISFLEPDSYSGFSSCAGLMVRGRRKILIDANMGGLDTRPLLAAERPDAAIITHYHVDHSAWGADVQELTGARLYLPAGETHILRDLPTIVGHTAGPYGLTSAWSAFVTENCRFRPIAGAAGYDAGTDFGDAGIRMRIVETPGHSPGHASVFFPDDGVLFTGDMGLDRFGPWYGWGDCSLPDLVQSLRRLKELGARVLLTSHGGMITERIAECWDRALGIIFQREADIVSALESGVDKDRIVADGVFFHNKGSVPEPVKSFLFMWDSFMFDHHASLLKAGGLAAVLR